MYHSLQLQRVRPDSGEHLAKALSMLDAVEGSDFLWLVDPLQVVSPEQSEPLQPG